MRLARLLSYIVYTPAAPVFSRRRDNWCNPVRGDPYFDYQYIIMWVTRFS